MNIIVHVEDTSGCEATRPAFINGKAITYPINEPFEAGEELLNVLESSDMNVERLSETGSSQAVEQAVDADEGAALHGGAGGATLTPGFDPEAIIEGTVGEVAEKLSALTAEELQAVRAAEIDREVPRKGVAKAIEQALAKIAN